MEIKEKGIDLLLDQFGICSIPEDRNYWLVRTNSGKNFNDFYMGDFIAIGHEDLPLYDNIDLNLIKTQNIETIREEVETFNPDHGRPGIIVNHLDKFVNQMKMGDIVLCPSENSTYIAFGELLDDDIIEISRQKSDDFYEEGRCYFRKRRKVNWFKYIEKDDLDLYLHKLLNSHYAVTNANDYSHYIDRSLYNFFIKKGQVHVIFEVKKDKNILAVEILNFINNVINTVDVYNRLYKDDHNKNDIDIKINVQSPGPIEFSAYLGVGLIIAIAIIGLAGGKGRFKKTEKELEGELETDGLIVKLLEFYRTIKENKLKEKEMEWKENFQKSSQELNIKIPGMDEEE